MKTAQRLQSLIEEGLIDSMLRQLISGKEVALRRAAGAGGAVTGRFVHPNRP